jgi:putative transposase
MKGRDNILWKTKPLLEMVNKPWKNFLAGDVHEPEIELFRKYERIGRLLGLDSFIGKIESLLGRRLKI